MQLCSFSHTGMYNILPAFIVCIQTTLADFQKVLTDEQESRKSLDASVKALTVSLCIVTDVTYLRNIAIHWT